MTRQRPLFWREGMFVRSHHFQQWDLHLADRLKSLLEQIEPDGWGVAHLAVNDPALQEERFEVDEALLVFRDGAVVALPGNAGTASKAARAFQGRIQGVGGRLGVHLGVRLLNHEGPNVAEPGATAAAPPRWLVHREPQGTNDLATGINPQEIEFLEYDLRVLFDGDDLQGFDTIKVAEIRRGTQQARPFVLSDDYAPPSLRLGASQVLKRAAARALQHIHRTTGTLHQAKPQMFGAEAASAANLRTILLSQALHGAYPALQADIEGGRAHPRRAFERLVSLAGSIAATWEDRDPHALPRYDHQNAAPAYNAVCDQIVDDLKRLYPSSYEEIPLERDNDYFYADLPPAVLERGARLYLALTTSRVADQVTSALKPLMKIGSRTRVQDLVRRKLAGVPVEPCPAPGEYPSKEPVFYKLSPGGEEWRQVESEATFGAYMPFGDPAGRASLIVIRSEGGTK